MCNGGTSAALTANVTGGSIVTAIWKQWTHQQGPIMVWMYACQGADMKSCDGTGEHWFKINQTGMWAPPLKGINWGTAIVYSHGNYTVQIPKTLKSGLYLIRHELIAQHQANNPQFYAECAQLSLTGSGTAFPSAEYMAKIPGYALQSDPGVTVCLSWVSIILCLTDI
jgi:Auxiliary Activity family 9 (formerly GH61)